MVDEIGGREQSTVPGTTRAPTNPVGEGTTPMAANTLVEGQADAQMRDEELMAEIDRLIGETPPETQEALKRVLETPDVNQDFVVVMEGLLGQPVASFFSEIITGLPEGIGSAESDMSSRVAPEAPTPQTNPAAPTAPAIPINKPTL